MTLALLTNLKGQFGNSDDDEGVTFTPEDFADSSEKVKQRISILVNKNIPLTPQNLRKIQIPLPAASESENSRRIALQHTDDLISMSDGQIWLDESLYNKGQRPAMDAEEHHKNRYWSRYHEQSRCARYAQPSGRASIRLCSSG